MSVFIAALRRVLNLSDLSHSFAFIVFDVVLRVLVRVRAS